MILNASIIDGVHTGSIKAVRLHGKFVSFVINKYFLRRYFEAIQTSCFFIKLSFSYIFIINKFVIVVFPCSSFETPFQHHTV